MKEVVYKNGKKFLLTNEEFDSAMMSWNDTKSYWCDRIEQMLGPYFDSAGTPPEEVGRLILINPKDQYERRYFVKNNEYLEILKGGAIMETKFKNDKEKEMFVKNLVSQEDFYNRKKLLK